MESGLSFVGFLLGLGVALATFVVKDAVAYGITGHRFRRRLANYAGYVVKGYAEALPDLEELIRKITADREKNVKDIRWAFQWDAPPAGAAMLVENSVHLSPEAQKKSGLMWDALQRADRIRDVYNRSVVSQVSGGTGADGAAKLAATSLRDLRWEFREVLGRGSELLLELSRTYPLLGLSRADIQKQLESYEQKGFLNVGGESPA